MEATQLRKLAIDSVKDELEKIEVQIVKAAKKGELKIYIKDMTPAAKQYFKDKGYEIKISIVDQWKDHWMISW